MATKDEPLERFRRYYPNSCENVYVAPRGRVFCKLEPGHAGKHEGNSAGGQGGSLYRWGASFERQFPTVCDEALTALCAMLLVSQDTELDDTVSTAMVAIQSAKRQFEEAQANAAR